MKIENYIKHIPMKIDACMEEKEATYNIDYYIDKYILTKIGSIQGNIIIRRVECTSDIDLYAGNIKMFNHNTHSIKETYIRKDSSITIRRIAKEPNNDPILIKITYVEIDKLLIKLGNMYGPYIVIRYNQVLFGFLFMVGTSYLKDTCVSCVMNNVNKMYTIGSITTNPVYGGKKEIMYPLWGVCNLDDIVYYDGNHIYDSYSLCMLCKNSAKYLSGECSIGKICMYGGKDEK